MYRVLTLSALTLISALSWAGLSDDPAPLSAALELARSQPTLYTECTVVSRNLDPVSGTAERSRGTLRYTQQANRFRIDTRMKGDHATDATITFDGAVFQYSDHDTGGHGASPGLPPDGNFGSALPVPFLEALSFLTPVTEANDHEYRTWLSIAGASVPSPSVGWHDIARDGRPCLQATFPGSTYEGVDYSFVVTADTRDAGWPWIVERITSTGAVLTRSTFESIEPFGAATGQMDSTSGGVATPLVMRFEMFDPTGTRQLHELLFVVTDLRLGSNAAAMATEAAFQVP